MTFLKVLAAGLIAALLIVVPALGRIRAMSQSPAWLAFLMAFVLASMLDTYGQLRWGGQERHPRPETDDWPKWANLTFLIVVTTASLERARGMAVVPRFGMLPWIGISLIIGATTLRTSSVLSLGSRFKSFMAVSTEGLATTGVFSKLRHPSYLGALLLLFGVSLALSSVIGLLLSAVVMVPIVAQHVQKEEAFLACEYGETWKHYAVRTARLIPGLY